MGQQKDSIFYYNEMRTVDAEIEKSFWGIAMHDPARKELAYHGTTEGPRALISLANFKYFSSVSIADWTLLSPSTQDWFISNRYIVLRKIIPPFVLDVASSYYRQLIENGVLILGDVQAKRYVAYNDRIGRFIHNQLTQLIRKVIAHNAKPSYTYFGGYVGGSKLVPHTDREQCQFTLSLNIEQYPYNKTWLLSLDKVPLFDREKIEKRPNNVKTEDESQIADADLYAGDGLIFMGRQLIHFRRGDLPNDQWTNQIFLHYVEEDFADELT